MLPTCSRESHGTLNGEREHPNQWTWRSCLANVPPGLCPLWVIGIKQQ